MPEKRSGLFYTGDGSAFLVGVPARDLDPEEVDALTDDQVRNVEASGLYRKTRPASSTAADVGSQQEKPAPKADKE